MPSRHKSRQRALQILFQWDARKLPVDDAIRAYYETLYSEESEEKPPREAFVDQLVRGVVERIEEIDAMIVRHAEHWKIPRMPAVDRNVLRMAVYEMQRVGTPAAVVIDEAIELARRYSGEEAVNFINGVLDAARREMEGPKAEAGGPV
jgi:N utilization substance protein B